KYIAIDSGTHSFSGLTKINANKDILVFGTRDWDYQLSYMLDSTGNMEWSHRYFIPITPNNVPYYHFYDMTFTDDSGFIIAGSTCDSLYKQALALFRFDSTGNLIWTKRYHFFRQDYCTAIVPKPNGKFALCAATFKTYPQGNRGAVHFLIIDSLGNILKSKRIGNDSISFAPHSMKPLGNDFIVEGTCGLNFSYPEGYYFLMKLDNSGNVLKTKIFKGQEPYKERGLQVTRNNKIIYGFGDMSTPSFNLMQLDENLNVNWCKTITPYGTRMDLPFITETPDSNYLMFGYRFSGGTAKSVGCKIDTSGNVIAGFLINYLNGGFARQILSYGNKLLVHAIADQSNNYTEGMLFTTDFNLNASCYTVPTGFNAIPFPITDSLVTINYFANYFPIYEDSIYVSDTTLNYTIGDLCSPNVINEITTNSTIQVFPNPTNSTLTIFTGKIESITVINLFGEVIIEKNVSSNKGKIELDVSFLAPGIYFIRAGNEVRKFVKE
ncbi:MAG: T9SS type A sorting domain-containing protein, partial [Bacteroidota bacterium]